MAIDLYSWIIYPLIYIFPAYVANALPVIFGGGPPLDFGKKINRHRVLGDNKTIKGTAAGIAGGVVVGLIEWPFLGFMLAIAAWQAFGAVFGDLAGSFIKRRLGWKSGSMLPIMDQYGFFIFAIAFSAWLGHLPSVIGLVFIVIVTGIAHVLSNRIAHRLRLKDVPW